MTDNDLIKKVFSDMESYYSENLGLEKEQIFTPYEIGIETSKSTFKGKDEQTTIGGRKGFVKSTLGFWISIGQFGGIGNATFRDFAFRLLENNFIYSANARYVLEQVQEKYINLPRYNPVQIDEGKVFYIRNFMKSENRELIIWMGSNRKQLDIETGEIKGNKHLIICLDDFLQLDSGVRATTNRHIEMISPGVGVMLKPIPLMMRDRWLLDWMQKTQMDNILNEGLHSSHLLSIKKIIDLYARIPTFEGIVVCPSMDLRWGENFFDKDGAPIIGEIEKRYIELDGNAKKAERDKRKVETQKKEDRWRIATAKLADYVRKEKGLTAEEVAKAAGVPRQTLSQVKIPTL